MNHSHKFCFWLIVFHLWIVIFAQETTQVEIVFKDGTSIKGILLNYGQRTYQIQINGQTQTFSEKDIQTVRFEGENKASSSETSSPQESLQKDLNPSAEEKNIENILKSKVTLDFSETPLTEVLNFFRVITGLNIVVMRQVNQDIPLTINVNDVEFKTVFALLQFFMPIEYRRENNIFMIVPRTSESSQNSVLSPYPVYRLKELEQKDPDLLRKLEGLSMTLNFSDTPIEDVLAFLRDISGINMAINPKVFQERVKEKLKMDMFLSEVPLFSILQMMEPILDLEFVVVNREVLWLTIPENYHSPESETFRRLERISGQLGEYMRATEMALALKEEEEKLRKEEELVNGLKQEGKFEEAGVRLKKLQEFRKRQEEESLDWIKKYQSSEKVNEKYKEALEEFFKMQQQVKDKDEALYQSIANKKDLFFEEWNAIENLYWKVKNSQEFEAQMQKYYEYRRIQQLYLNGFISESEYREKAKEYSVDMSLTLYGLLSEAKEFHKNGKPQEALSKLARIPKNTMVYEEANNLKKQIYRDAMLKEIVDLYQEGQAEESLRLVEEVSEPTLEPLQKKMKLVLNFFNLICEQLALKEPNTDIIIKNAQKILELEPDMKNWYAQESQKMLKKYKK